MRATVLVSEYLIYIPAAIIFARRQARLKSVNVWEASIALVAILMQPATMLIDHGHFQYNTVMLGFVLASMSSMFANRLLWGCVFFVAALSFKQMALYYAPAIFAYLLGVCLFPKPRIFRLLAIAFVTLTSFVAMFTPILLGSLYENMQDPSIALTLPPPPLLTSLPIDIDRNSPFYPIVLQLSQSLHRIFPFARGLFEDKVANLWCALHTIHKLTTYPNSLLTRLSLVCTIAAILPACTIILLYPRKALLPYSLAACAWGFFLCSFQVHEKSVLLPLLPMTVLLGSSRGIGPELRAWIGWANALGVWTMYPLLQRDGLRVPYAILALLWAYLLGLPPASWVLYSPAHGELTAPTKLLHLSFYIAMGIWHVLEAGLAPPKGKPDLWVVINCVVGAVGFALCWAWCTWQVVIRSGFLEEWIGVRVRFDEGQEERVDGKANARRKRQ
jgi:alpha-1,3-glucosyltransferase